MGLVRRTDSGGGPTGRRRLSCWATPMLATAQLLSTAAENWPWLTLRESPAVLLAGPATTASRARPRVVTSEYSPGRSSADERSATHSRKVRQNPKTDPWRHLKIDPLPVVWSLLGGGGCGRDAAEVSVFEPVAVAFRARTSAWWTSRSIIAAVISTFGRDRAGRRGARCRGHLSMTCAPGRGGRARGEEPIRWRLLAEEPLAVVGLRVVKLTGPGRCVVG